MRFKLEFACDNAQFDENCPLWAIGEILREVEQAVLDSETDRVDQVRPIYDVNGNKIGNWRIEDAPA